MSPASGIRDIALTRVGKRFGENLIARRREAGLSQQELGARASLHRTTIGQLERGERIPHIGTLIKLAEALEIGAESLLDDIQQG